MSRKYVLSCGADFGGTVVKRYVPSIPGHQEPKWATSWSFEYALRVWASPSQLMERKNGVASIRMCTPACGHGRPQGAQGCADCALEDELFAPDLRRRSIDAPRRAFL